jgi:hypothetical protein
MIEQTYRYCGREFLATELDQIRAIIAAPDQPRRAEIARRVCRQLSWYRPNGELKAMSCRVALLKMHRDSLILLPKPRGGNGNGRIRRHLDPGEVAAAITRPLAELLPLRIDRVVEKDQSREWNEQIARHHYLGYVPLPGAQLRYLVHARDGRLLSALGFAAAAWKMAARDRWIGWDAGKREANLNYIVNNNRFLILPHVQVANLASKILGEISRRIGADWEREYGYRVYLLETLVERERFHGTSYRAANWQCLGQTQGRGKLDRLHAHAVPVKDIWVYPLHRHWRDAVLALPSPNAAD